MSWTVIICFLRPHCLRKQSLPMILISGLPVSNVRPCCVSYSRCIVPPASAGVSKSFE